MKQIDYSNPKYYENRELSWLKFNKRVLTEAGDSTLPLFERLKFLSITASNLDEFIMVRVASLIDMYTASYDKTDIAGMTVAEQLKAVERAVHIFVKEQYSIYNDQLLPELNKNGLSIIKTYKELSPSQGMYVDRYFEEEVYPVLTPMAVDSSRPFPLIRNKTLNIGALVLKKQGEDKEFEFATVQVPDVLKRVIELPPEKGEPKAIILLEEIIEKNIHKLFLNYNIECTCQFRIMRNADLSIDEDEAEDLLKEIERQVRMRQWGEAIRLEVREGIDRRLLKIIQDELMIKHDAIFHIQGPLDLTFLMKVYGLPEYEYLREHSYLGPQDFPLLPPGCDFFNRIKEQDMLLVHPYQTFTPIVEFVKQAAVDKNVLAIKQTLYRVSGNSPIIAALAEAAENGKQVTVLVELKARFDEENNIIWAKRLEKAGCHVIYGLVGLKTHSKITLVVRREEDGIIRYVHLGTGNYNDSTARLYTDVGLLTADEAIGEDATAVFNMLSGYSEPLNWNKLTIAPLWLKDRFLSLIRREIAHVEEGRKGHIIAKMNSVCEPCVMQAIYEAASKGVKIELIVRGICCLKTDVPGLNGNLTVRSIVGNFLEHARIFFFENGGKPEYYCSSADWMSRNLDRRVEILFPVEKESLKSKLKTLLELQLKDNQKAHVLTESGEYIRVKDTLKENDAEPINSQLCFCLLAKDTGRVSEAEGTSRIFVPKTSIY